MVHGDSPYILSLLGVTCVCSIQSALQRFSSGTAIRLLQL